MRTTSLEAAERRKAAKTGLADSRWVPFGDVKLILGGNKFLWPRIEPVRDRRVCEMFHQLHPRCWISGDPAEAHHGASGSRGKRDSLALLFAISPYWHARVNTPELPLGRLLALKYKHDWPHTDWVYMTLAWGYLLPDLILHKVRWGA